MSTSRRLLTTFIEREVIPPDKIDDALIALKLKPDGDSWRRFIDQLLLWIGGLALAFGVMFFIAYNWRDLGHFAKFAMVEGFIVLTVGVYCNLEKNTMASKVSLLVATVSLGVLLALYGQTYQTGADPWQLFFNWALFMLPWAVIGRFPAIWIVWVALINVSIILYGLTFRGIFGVLFSSEVGMLWSVFLFNSLVFVGWQLLAMKYHWLLERWAIRLLAVGSGVALNWLVLFSIFEPYGMSGVPGVVWMFWLGAMFYVYKKVQLDLFMLAGCCLSIIVVTVTMVGKSAFHHSDAGAFLILALLVIGMGGGAALWLKKVHQESQL